MGAEVRELRGLWYELKRSYAMLCHDLRAGLDGCDLEHCELEQCDSGLLAKHLRPAVLKVRAESHGS